MTRSLLERPRLEAPTGRRVSAEAVAVAALAWALWHMAGRFGGVDLPDAVRALAPLLAALPAAARGAALLGRRWSMTVTGVALGLILSVAAAAYRSDAVAPLLTYGAMLVVGLATIAIWKVDWGPVALVAVGVIAGARAWWIGLEGWYGSSLDASSIDRWMALPWHNQSGTLMAALAVALGVAAATAGRWRYLAGAGASLAGAATLLAGSRGATIALVLGCACGMAAFPRRWGRWAAMVTATGLLIPMLTNLPGAAAGDSGPSLPAVQSSSARIAHWEAAVGMFIDAPLTGQGVGSYRLASPQWASGDVNPTSHAHNEFLELLAEGGLLVGVPALLLVGGVLVGAGRILPRRVPATRRHRVAAGAAAVWVVLAAHAAIDFDWLFPILAVAFAVTAGVIAAQQPPTAPRPAPVTVVVVAALLLVALGAGYVEGFRRSEGAVHPPWNATAASARAEQAVDAGDYDRAAAIARQAARWNPADPRPDLWQAVAAMRSGDTGARPVVAAARSAAPGFGVRLDAAHQLLAAGHHAQARALVTETIASFDRYQGWNLAGAAAVAYRLSVSAAGLDAGCPAAVAAAERAVTTPLATAFGGEDYRVQASVFCSQ